MKRLCLIVTFALVCACANLPLKQRAVVSLAASEMALETAHNTERSICSPTSDQSKAITHCDGPQAATFGLTDARHKDLALAFSRAFAAESLAAMTLQRWKAGDPAPTTLVEYQRLVNDILNTILAILPQAKDLTAQTQKASVAVADAVKATGGAQ